MINPDARRARRPLRIVVTGLNGTGKSHFAKRVRDMRPDLPIVSYDALRLTTNWQRRPKDSVDAQLSHETSHTMWLLEGGPSLLPISLPRAQLVIWLDPPHMTRARQLLMRPIRHLGTTRPELPDGNPDHFWQQTRFALRSLLLTRRNTKFIDDYLSQYATSKVLRCRADTDLAKALDICTTPITQ